MNDILIALNNWMIAKFASDMDRLKVDEAGGYKYDPDLSRNLRDAERNFKETLDSHIDERVYHILANRNP